MIKFSFKGINILKNRIDKANTQLESILFNVLENEASYIETMSKLNVPYKTGALRGSQYRKLEKARNMRAHKIGFYKTYGVYQEFGGFASQFKVGTPKVPVRPNRYFLHYFVLSRKRLSRDTSKIFKRLLR